MSRPDPYDAPAVRPAGKGFALDRRNRRLAGVCAGLSRRFGWDVTLIRAGFVLGTLLGFGSLLIVYVALALLAD